MKKARRGNNAKDTADDQHSALVTAQPRSRPSRNGEARKDGATVQEAVEELYRLRHIHEKAHWEDCGLLGKGAFGVVKKVRNKLDNVVFARKEIISLLLQAEALHAPNNHKAFREVRAMLAVKESQHVVHYHHSYLEELPNETLNTLLANMMLSFCLWGVGASQPQPPPLALPAPTPSPSPSPTLRAMARPPLPFRAASPSPRDRPHHRQPRNATPPPNPGAAAFRRCLSMPARRRAPITPIELLSNNTPTPPATLVATPNSVEHPPTPPSTLHPLTVNGAPNPQFPTPLFMSPHLAIATRRTPPAPLAPPPPQPLSQQPASPANSTASVTPDGDQDDLDISSDRTPLDSPTHGLLSPPDPSFTHDHLTALTPHRLPTPPSSSSSSSAPPSTPLVCTLFLGAILLLSRPPSDPHGPPSSTAAATATATESSHPGVQGITTDCDDDGRGDLTREERLKEKQRQGYRLWKVCILMELIDGPTLQAWLEDRNKEATDKVCIRTRELSILRQLFSGVFDIHSCSYLHRDIKPANIYLQHPRRRSLSSDPPRTAPHPPADPRRSSTDQRPTPHPPPDPTPIHTPDPNSNPHSGTAVASTHPPSRLSLDSRHDPTPAAPGILDIDYKVKIGDFGLAVPVNEHGKVQTAGGEADLDAPEAYSQPPPHVSPGEYYLRERSGGVGTVTYQAPEMQAVEKGARRGGRREGGKAPAMYGRAVDMFSSGLVMLEVLVPLKTGHERLKVFKEAREGRLPEALVKARPDLAELILSLLNPDPTKRPTARDLFNHEALTINPPTTPSTAAAAAAASSTPTTPAAAAAATGPTTAAAPAPSPAAHHLLTTAASSPLCTSPSHQHYVYPPRPSATPPQPCVPARSRLAPASAPDSLLSPSPPKPLSPARTPPQHPPAATLLTASLPPSPRGNPPARTTAVRTYHARSNSLPHAMPPARQQQLLTPPAATPPYHPHPSSNDLASDQSHPLPLPPRGAPAPTPIPTPTPTPFGTPPASFQFPQHLPQPYPYPITTTPAPGPTPTPTRIPPINNTVFSKMVQAQNSELSVELTRLKEDLAAARRQIADRDRQIADCTAQIADRDNKLLQRDRDNQTLRAELEATRAQLKAQGIKTRNLMSQIAPPVTPGGAGVAALGRAEGGGGRKERGLAQPPQQHPHPHALDLLQVQPRAVSASAAGEEGGWGGGVLQEQQLLDVQPRAVSASAVEEEGGGRELAVARRGSLRATPEQQLAKGLLAVPAAAWSGGASASAAAE